MSVETIDQPVIENMAGGDEEVVLRSNGNSKDEQDALGNFRPAQQNAVARMSTERCASYYNMGHKSRGRAIIFNHEKFLMQGLKPRNGTQVDCDNIQKCFKDIGFEVEVFNDCSFDKIRATIGDAATYDYTDCDCLIVCVLSHGEMGILYAKDAAYKPDLLWSPFVADSCPSLAGKPKLFFIQACQGDKLDGGITLSNRTETDGHPPESYRIPSHADFLITYSTIPGFYSWRNTTRGSWFMQALCEELQTNAYNYDLLTLLTFVNQRVAIDFESNTPDSPVMHRQKQIPCITSMLTRLLRFNKPAGSVIEQAMEAEESKTKEKGKGVFSTLFGSK